MSLLSIQLCFFSSLLMLILLASQVRPLTASPGVTFVEEPLWENACSGGNGLQHSSQEDSNSSKNAARNSIRTSIENIRVVLNVNNMHNKSKSIAEDWSLHRKYYNFLKSNATGNTIATHREIQKYLASFQYFAETHNSSCTSSNNCESGEQKTTKENLNEIKIKLKDLLCEIEMFLNTTQLVKKFNLISRNEMQNILTYHGSDLDTSYEINSFLERDAAYARVYLMSYIDTMEKNLNKTSVPKPRTCFNIKKKLDKLTSASTSASSQGKSVDRLPIRKLRQQLRNCRCKKAHSDGMKKLRLEKLKHLKPEEFSVKKKAIDTKRQKCLNPKKNNLLKKAAKHPKKSAI